MSAYIQPRRWLGAGMLIAPLPALAQEEGDWLCLNVFFGDAELSRDLAQDGNLLQVVWV